MDLLPPPPALPPGPPHALARWTRPARACCCCSPGWLPRPPAAAVTTAPLPLVFPGGQGAQLPCCLPAALAHLAPPAAHCRTTSTARPRPAPTPPSAPSLRTWAAGSSVRARWRAAEMPPRAARCSACTLSPAASWAAARTHPTPHHPTTHLRAPCRRQVQGALQGRGHQVHRAHLHDPVRRVHKFGELARGSWLACWSGLHHSPCLPSGRAISARQPGSFRFSASHPPSAAPSPPPPATASTARCWRTARCTARSRGSRA